MREILRHGLMMQGVVAEMLTFEVHSVLAKTDLLAVYLG
jgi:hypothetical protein